MLFLNSIWVFAAPTDQVDCKVSLTRIFRSGSGKQIQKKVDILQFNFNPDVLSLSQSHNIHTITVSVSSVSSQSAIKVKVVDKMMSEEALSTEFDLSSGGAFTNQKFKFLDNDDMYDPARISCKSTILTHESKPEVNNSNQKNLNLAPSDSTRVSMPRVDAGALHE